MIKCLGAKYKFLSNSFECEIVYEGIKFRTVEHAYQTIKCSTFKDKIKITNLKDPIEARKYGRRVHLRDSWINERLDVMRKLLILKFTKPVFKDKLKELEGEEIIVHNTKHDTFWEKCYCKIHKGYGDNELGKLLTELSVSL